MTSKTLHRSAFLAAFARCGVITHAAALAGVDRSTVFRWRESDPDFEEAFQDAMEQAADSIEQEAMRRAVQGYEEPVIYQGQPTYLFQRDESGKVLLDENGHPRVETDEAGRPKVLTVRKYSDQLLALILKGHKAKYREKTGIELTGANGGPLEITDSERAARISAIMTSAQQRKDAQELAPVEDGSDLV